VINVGIIGCGYWGPNLIRNFHQNSKCKVKKVSDLREGRLDFIKGLYDDIITTMDANDIISDPEIDAVVIATPVNTHKDIAVLAMQNGKHVFIEKPLTNNIQSAVEVVETAEKLHKIVSVGHIFQFAPAVTALKNEIEKGTLGKVFHYSSQRINLGPPKTTVDVVWDLAPHDLSIVLYLFNEFPNKVLARGASYLCDGFVDNAHILMDFPSGKTAHIHLGWLSSKKTRRTLVFGEKGNFEYDETLPDAQKVVFYDKGIDNRLNAKDNVALKYGEGEVRPIEVVKGEPLALEVDAFLTAIQTGKPAINDGVIGMEVVKILEKATQSMMGN
jgi:predicted dehydrogenase